MKTTIIATTLAALLASSALPAIAQDAGAGTETDAGVSVETPAVDAEAGAGADAAVDTAAGGMSEDTYSSVTTAISGSADVDLSAVTEESQVTIVLLSSLEGDAATEGAALDEALAADMEGQTTLHSNIEANAAITAKLEAEGHAASDVVAVKSNADGSVTVYVDDRA